MRTILTFLLSSLFGGNEGLKYFSNVRRSSSRCELSSRFSADFEMLSQISRSVAVPTNTTATLINLIQFGDNWATETMKDSGGEFNRFRKGEKVRGCMADVRITTSFEYPDSIDLSSPSAPSSSDPMITIDGSADSRVAQGILALLCKGLNNQPSSKVLTLSPEDLSRECGLNVLLPVGRLNGLHNMVALIQDQIKQEFDKHTTDTIRNSDGIRSAVAESSRLEEVDTSDEIAVLLSGGVDSSVALKLLQLQGHKVRAFYLKIWLEDEVAHLNECPWEEDLGYAESVCTQLGVPLETLSLQKEYWEEVVQYTFREARNGRTPNPDVLCNSRIKFGMFYEYVGKHYSKIATGHYAQVLYGDENVQKSNAAHVVRAALKENEKEKEQSRPSAVIEVGESSSSEILEIEGELNAATDGVRSAATPTADVVAQHTSQSQFETETVKKEGETNDKYARLVMSPDAVKDQTYFLSALSQEQLAKAIFPIGHLEKHEVRELAEKFLLPTRARKDSQGICFLGKLKFDEFIEHYLGEKEGTIRSYETGKILGHHRGLWFHTIGQRKGLGPHLQSVVHDGPWYVAAKEAQSNTLYVTNDLTVIDRPRLEFSVRQMNWVSGSAPSGIEEGLTMDIKLRHGPTLSKGTVKLSRVQIPEKTSDVGGDAMGDAVGGAWEEVLSVVLSKKDKGIAPGQFAAFYSGSECLGAGMVADTAIDVFQREEEHISVAKSRLAKSPSSRSSNGALLESKTQDP